MSLLRSRARLFGTGGPDRALAPDIARLWTAFAVSEAGSAVAAGALALIAMKELHVSDWQVSVLAAVGALAAATLGLPLGPAIERRRKRPVMIAADLVRAVALVSLPIAAWTGHLTFTQLCLVAAVAATGSLAFAGASGAHLKGLVPTAQRAAVNSRWEATGWLTLVAGPPLGGVVVDRVGATASSALDALSFVVSALGIRSLRSPEPSPPDLPRGGGWRAMAAGWTYLLGHPGLRALYANALLFGGALMWAMPQQNVLMLRELGFSPIEFGLALGLPCLGGAAGAALAPRLLLRYGERTVLLASGVARTLWLAPIALAPAGEWGMVVVVAADTALLLCAGVFNPTFTTYRMRETADSHMARVGTAWSVGSRLAQPVGMLVGGAVAAMTSTRWSIGAAAMVLVGTGLLLPWRERPGLGPEEDTEEDPGAAGDAVRHRPGARRC